MKQFQIAYETDEAFLEALEEIKQWCSENTAHAVLFRIYSGDMELAHVKHVCDILSEQMPQALYYGCTTQANILEGALATTEISLSCTVFEYDTTQVQMLQLPFGEEDVTQTVRQLRQFCQDNPWVSAVEVHATILGMSMRQFCAEISTLRSDIQIFGGGACNTNPYDLTTSVFSKGNGITDHGIVFLLLGGRDLHTYSMFISGWKPLKRRFKITKSTGATLYELDGEPALNIYRRFLNIENSDNLVSNTLEFPLFTDQNGVDVMRCPTAADADGTLFMTAEVDEGADVRLAYGDPETILTSIRRDGQNIANFRPETIQTFSCAARRAFWSDDNISDETILFNSVAPTSGFYTGGELLRVDGIVHHFNVTLVLVAMREGEPKNDPVVDLYDTRLDNLENNRIPLIRRFVSFIEASTTELEETNSKLSRLSVTDGLTGLYNRSEIERRIRSAVEARAQSGASDALSVIMLDIDDFKKINDRYGHKEGDRVIIALADILREVMADMPSASLGRWGGEEFMVLLPDKDINEAEKLAETIRARFATVTYETAGCQTASLGVARARDGEDADTLYTRVDTAMYTAKANGKNPVVRL